MNLAAAGDLVLDVIFAGQGQIARLVVDVNGVRRPTGSTATTIFKPHDFVHHLGQFVVLEPGDLTNAGTPPGAGLGLRTPVCLRPGDVMELGIDGLGMQRQVDVAAR